MAWRGIWVHLLQGLRSPLLLRSGTHHVHAVKEYSQSSNLAVLPEVIIFIG